MGRSLKSSASHSNAVFMDFCVSCFGVLLSFPTWPFESTEGAGHTTSDDMQGPESSKDGKGVDKMGGCGGTHRWVDNGPRHRVGWRDVAACTGGYGPEQPHRKSWLEHSDSRRSDTHRSQSHTGSAGAPVPPDHRHPLVCNVTKRKPSRDRSSTNSAQSARPHSRGRKEKKHLRDRSVHRPRPHLQGSVILPTITVVTAIDAAAKYPAGGPRRSLSPATVRAIDGNVAENPGSNLAIRRRFGRHGHAAFLLVRALESMVALNLRRLHVPSRVRIRRKRPIPRSRLATTTFIARCCVLRRRECRNLSAMRRPQKSVCLPRVPARLLETKWLIQLPKRSRGATSAVQRPPKSAVSTHPPTPSRSRLLQVKRTRGAVQNRAQR